MFYLHLLQCLSQNATGAGVLNLKYKKESVVMFPYIDIFGFELELYYVFHFLSLLIVTVLAIRWNYKYGPKFRIGLEILLFIGISYFIVGRLAHYVLFAYPDAKLHFFDLQYGGNMFIGALIGGILGCLLYFEIKGIPKLQGLELFLPYIPIGGILGRLGCLCEGCCFGKISDGPLAIRFPHGSPVWYEHLNKGLISYDDFFSLPVHPTQLYEIVAWIIIGCILLPLHNRKPRRGVILLSFFILLFIHRFFYDFFRADYPEVYLGLDIMQITAIFVVPVGMIGLLFIYRDKWAGLFIKQSRENVNI